MEWLPLGVRRGKMEPVRISYGNVRSEAGALYACDSSMLSLVCAVKSFIICTLFVVVIGDSHEMFKIQEFRRICICADGATGQQPVREGSIFR